MAYRLVSLKAQIIADRQGDFFDKISDLMLKLKDGFIFPLFLLVLCPCAYSQLPGPVFAPDVQFSTSSPLEQLACLPEFPINFSTAAVQQVTEEEVVDLEEGEESEANIFISSALAHTPEPVNLGGNGRLTLTRNDNGEKLTVRYRLPDGSYDPEALAKLDHLMRCSLTGSETRMSVKLIELLDAVEDKFGKKGLVLLSGYRTFKNNGRTPGAVKHSLHMLGWAADIRIPGYSSAKVKKYGQKMWVGGVGYYPYKGFTHLDVGKTRYWVVRRPPRRRRICRPVKRTLKHAAARKAAAKRKTLTIVKNSLPQKSLKNKS